MKQEFLAWNLDINDGLTTSLTSSVIVVALGVATICFICNVAYNYLTTGFNKLVGEGSESFPNYGEIARCIVLILCISSYLPIAKIVVGTMETVNKATSSDRMENIKSFYNFQKANEIASPEDINIIKDENGKPKTIIEKVDDAISSGMQKVQDETTGIAKIAKDLGNLVSVMLPQNFALLVFHAVVNLLVFIIKIIIQGVAVILTKVLVIVGPLAFAFSILPCFRKQLEQWFATLVTTGMTFTTVNILDAIVDAATGHLLGDMNPESITDLMAQSEHRIELIALDCVIIVLYCSCFWLTSKYVGKGDAGRVISKLVSTATTLAAIAITGGAAAPASAAKSAGVNAAANTAKGAIEG